MTTRRRPKAATRKTSSAAPLTVNLSHLHAARVLPKRCPSLRLIQVGCGGIGAFLGTSTARLARECQSQYEDITIQFFDGDTVEERNIRRQNFCLAEVGQNKAESLAYRLNAAWGLSIEAYPRHFKSGDAEPAHDTLTVLLGCVDNGRARRALHQTLAPYEHHENDAQCWWIDAGNHSVTAQVLIGNLARLGNVQDSFPLPTICQSLPSPALLHPELLTIQPEEAPRPKQSCAELAAADPQSLTINAIVAAHMADYLLRLLITKDLRRFATYIDMNTGSARSLPTTPEQVAQALGQSPPAQAAVAGRSERVKGRE